MEVLLSTSPHIRHSAVLESDFLPRSDTMYTFAPLGLLSLSASLRQYLKITPVLYDINDAINKDVVSNSSDFYSRIAQSILSYSPDIVGFMTECDSYHHILQITFEIKNLNPDCFIVLGGPHATAVGEHTMKTWRSIDAIVCGEGEVTFVELVKSLEVGNIGAIDGAIIRTNDGKVIVGRARKLIQDINELPLPAYDLYEPSIGEELFIEVGRGCPFECTFCSTSPFWNRKHRVKSPERIVEEIKYLQELHNVSRVHFTHDLFTANQKWVNEVCHKLIIADLGVKWTCSSRVDTVNESLLSTMAEAGCSAIFFGIESGSKEILGKIKKRISKDETIETINLCKEYKITPNAGLIVGFPFETHESFKETFDLYCNLLKLGCKPLHIFSYCPFAQSSLYTETKDFEATEHFIDIPLPEENRMRNYQLIKKNTKLFASFYRAQLQNVIHGLNPSVLFAIDEFALLVDTIRIPSIYLAEALGGMDQLFFQWIDFISSRNDANRKLKFRRYFGSPLDFSDFLNLVMKKFDKELPDYIQEIVEVAKINFSITSKNVQPVPMRMSNYRSKTIPKKLSSLSYHEVFKLNNVIEHRKLKYQVFNAFQSDSYPPEIKEEETNLLWQQNGSDIRLLSVNSFVYSVVVQLKEKTNVSVKELIDHWYTQPDFDPSINIWKLLSELLSAQENKLIMTH